MNENENAIGENYVATVAKQFRGIKAQGERALAQVTDDEKFFAALDAESNSLAVIVKHMVGNMRSRWTDFWTTDGDKPDRNRDSEFVVDEGASRAELMAAWEDAWARVFAVVDPLTPADLLRVTTIRGEPHTVIESVNRQIKHYGEHVGQIVFLAKHLESERWQTLSIARGKSSEYRP